MDQEQKVQAIMAAGYGFGTLSVLAPRALGRSFGMAATSDEAVYLSRLSGLRNIALAQTLLVLGDDEGLRRRFLQVATAMFAADAVQTGLAGLSGKLPRRAAVSLVPVFGALAALAWSAAEG